VADRAVVAGHALLVGLLACFFDFRFAAGLFGFGLFFGRLALDLGLVLLGLALFGQTSRPVTVPVTSLALPLTSSTAPLMASVGPLF